MDYVRKHVSQFPPHFRRGQLVAQLFVLGF